MKCTWARGGASPAKATARCPTASWRRSSPTISQQLGYTHVEFLPVMDHPFFGSWGYQITGYFAPSGNFGTPQDLMYLIDTLHQRGIGVILDWVPSHFPSDEHGLGYFDGTHLYEHADPRQGYHPDWNSYIFNYGRNEVQSFLISNALFWLDKYHIDGLRVDAVASMLYLDYARKDGEWIPNQYGGRENLEAIDFLRRLNACGLRALSRCANHRRGVHRLADGVAADLCRRPRLRPQMGHGLDARHVGIHAQRSGAPALPSQTISPFACSTPFTKTSSCRCPTTKSVYGKGSLSEKMPGDDWQKFANLRALYGYMYAQPAKKLLFMGGEFGQWREWAHDASLDWDLLDYPAHAGVQRWVRDLNQLYREEPALHELDCDPAGFEWIDCDDAESSVVSLLRKGKSTATLVLAVCNFTPVPR